MTFEFIPITLDLKDEYETVRAKSPVKSADYTFTNIWGWAEYYGLSVAFFNGMAIIHQRYPHHCYWAPIGNWDNFDIALLKYLPNRKNFPKILGQSDTDILTPCRESSSDQAICFHRVPESFADLAVHSFGLNILKKEARGQWEYIYNRNDLANLSGNKFHKKKNHVNSFYKTYGNNYYTLQNDQNHKGSIEEVLFLQEEWCQWHDCDASQSLMAENDVIFRVMGAYNKLPNLVGGSLYAEDKMVAFAVGEKLTEDTMVIHFEKAKTEYRGSYQAINHAFVNNHTEEYAYINREQDMDEEGLRKAKESYLPVDYLKKSMLVLTV